MGNFYGPQENEQRQKAKTIYRNLRIQIIQAKQEGPVILTGDAKITYIYITKTGKHHTKLVKQWENNAKLNHKGAGMYPPSTHPT